jgi:hypothetical protein
MKGTILGFLKLAAENPELAQELADLAARYDFQFADDELRDEELDGVSGGTIRAGKTGGTAGGVVGLLQQAVAEERAFFKKLTALIAKSSDRRLQEDKELG